MLHVVHANILTQSTILLFVDMIAFLHTMRQLYDYLKTRQENPLKKMQALVVIGKKVLTLVFSLAKKKESYEPSKMFGEVRRNQLQAA